MLEQKGRKYYNDFVEKIYWISDKFSNFVWNLCYGKFMGDLSEIYQRPRKFFEIFLGLRPRKNFAKFPRPW